MDDRALWNALRCPCGACGGSPSDTATKTALSETVAWLRRIEAALGGHPVLVLAGGGWRCLSCADQIAEPHGGAHIEGKAVDIVLRDLAPVTVQKMLISRWPDLISGLGSQRGYSHIEWGGEPRKWRG